MNYNVSKLKDVLNRVPRKWHKLFRDAHRKTDNDEMIAIYEGHIGDGSASAFIYYVDTVGFFRKHRTAIVELLLQEHEEIGCGKGFVESISTWNCFGRQSGDKREMSELQETIVRVIAGAKEREGEDFTIVENGLTWGVMETISRYFVEESYD